MKMEITKEYTTVFPWLMFKLVLPLGLGSGNLQTKVTVNT